MDIKSLLALSILSEMRKHITTSETKHFRVEKVGNRPPDETGYASKKLADGTVLRFAIRKKAGKQGGHTKVTSVWKPKG